MAVIISIDMILASYGAQGIRGVQWWGGSCANGRRKPEEGSILSLMMCTGCSQNRSEVGGTVIVSEGLPWVERADTVWDSEGKASGESCRIEAAFQRTKEGRGFPEQC